MKRRAKLNVRYSRNKRRRNQKRKTPGKPAKKK